MVLMKAIGYVRVSTEKQADFGVSIDAQLAARIRRLSAPNGARLSYTDGCRLALASRTGVNVADPVRLAAISSQGVVEGTMAEPVLDPAFWRDLLAKFPRDSTLRADFCSTGWRDVTDHIEDGAIVSSPNSRWLLIGGAADARSLFESTAGLGAVALGYPNRPDAYEDWLDSLVRELGLRFDTEVAGSGFVNYPDWSERKGTDLADFRATQRVSTIGTVDDVCEKSRTFCRKLEAEAVKVELESRPVARSQQERIANSALSESRTHVIDPLLNKKGWSRRRWAERSGVDPSVTYGYMSGESTPNAESRQAIAESLGIAVSDLPE
jgi:hypothetical protein